MENFRSVFDGGNFHPGDSLFLLVFTGIGCFGIYSAIWKQSTRKNAFAGFVQRAFQLAVCVVFVAFGSVALFGVSVGFIELRHLLQSGHYQSVEGPVTQFDPMPLAGHKDESFSVNGVKFRYSNFRMTAGFHNAAAYGGPIHGDEYVRIAFLCRPSESDCSDPEIIKIEVKP